MCLLICALRTKLEMGKDGNAYCAMPKLGYESNCYKNDMCFIHIFLGEKQENCVQNREMFNEGLKTVFSTKLETGRHGNAYMGNAPFMNKFVLEK